MIDGALTDIRRDGGVITIQVRDPGAKANLATLALLVGKLVQAMANKPEKEEQQ